MLTVFNVFLKYTSTKWKYLVVVRDFVFSVLLGAARPDTSGGNGGNRDGRMHPAKMGG